MVQTVSVFVAAMALNSVVIGCKDSKADFINRTNEIYKNIKLIVRDEAVSKTIKTNKPSNMTLNQAVQMSDLGTFFCIRT